MMDASGRNTNDGELVGLMIQMLFFLQRKFPLPACIRPDMIVPEIFLSHGSSSYVLTNGLIYYLICIADPQIGSGIQWPIGTQSQSLFNSSVSKALIKLSKDYASFTLSNRTTLNSILRDRNGPKFNRFMFDLIRNSLVLASVNQGCRAVPLISADVRLDERLERMRHTTMQLSSSLAEKQNKFETLQDEQLLDRLIQKKAELQQRCHEIIQTCPTKYKEHLNAYSSQEQNGKVTDQWQAELNEITAEQAKQNQLLASYNNSTEAIKTVICRKLASEDLINNDNGPILFKTANENNIELPQSVPVPVSAFVESSSVITEKLKKLVLNKDVLKVSDGFGVPLEQSSRLLSEINQKVVDEQLQVDDLIKLGDERRRLYEEGVASEGGHEFPLPDVELEIRLDSPPAPYSPAHLIQSPGVESPKRALEEAKGRHLAAADKADSSKSSESCARMKRQKTHVNSSMSQLTKSVLQKQTLSATLASNANSTVGDMVPLSSSSPVSVRGGAPNQGCSYASKPARSSLADVLNELEESTLSFWDLTDDSSNLTFDSPEPPKAQPAQRPGGGLCGKFESRLPVPLPPSKAADGSRDPTPKPIVEQSVGPFVALPTPTISVVPTKENGASTLYPSTKRPSTAPASSPARRPRRSIQNLIDRLQKVKANNSTAQKGNQLHK